MPLARLARLLLFLPTPPGHSSTESGSAHPRNAPNTVSTLLVFTPSPPENSPTQCVAADPTNDPATSASIVPAPLEHRQMSYQIPRGEILLILSPCLELHLLRRLRLECPTWTPTCRAYCLDPTPEHSHCTRTQLYLAFLAPPSCQRGTVC